MDTHDLVRIKEAARQLAVSPGTIRRWRREGRLPLVRLPGGGVRVRVADINKLVCGDPGDE